MTIFPASWMRSGVATLLVLNLVGIAAMQPAYAQDRTEHLIRAAQHLDQAGLDELAAQVRATAQQGGLEQLQRLLDAKLQQRDELDKEIEQLQAALASGPQIRLKMVLIELDWAKLDRLGLPLFSLRQMFGEGGPASVSLDDDTIPKMLTMLEQQRAARVVCRPNLLTHSGRKASFQIGSAGNGRTRQDREQLAVEGSSLRLSCLPELKDDKMHIGVTMQWSANTADAPPTHRIDTEVVLDDGATVLIAGRTDPEAALTTSLLLLIEPKRVGK